MGTLQVVTFSHPVNTMVNYCNFKSTIVLKESPPVIDPKPVKVSAVPNGFGTDTKKTGREIYPDDKKNRIEYLVLMCLTVFVQTPYNMCLDEKMLSLYKHFVLHGNVLLSMYCREA